MDSWTGNTTIGEGAAGFSSLRTSAFQLATWEPAAVSSADRVADWLQWLFWFLEQLNKGLLGLKLLNRSTVRLREQFTFFVRAEKGDPVGLSLYQVSMELEGHEHADRRHLHPKAALRTSDCEAIAHRPLHTAHLY